MATVKEHVHGQVHEAEHHGSFWTRYVFSQDHKVIALQYMGTAWLMAAVGGLLALLIRLQLAFPERRLIQPDDYYAFVTMHGTIMVFFFLTAVLSGGFGNFLIPLQIGARDMAFPFLNMLSYWLVPPAALIAVASFFVPGGAAGSGWTAYPPLSALPEAGPGQGLGQTLWLVSVIILMIAFMLGGLNYITTVINLRTAGMSMTRLPLSVWGLFLTAIIGLFAFPVLMSAAIMLLFDRVGGTSFFVPGPLYVGGKLLDLKSGDPLLWQHLFWFFGHPEVYILILPVMGMVSDIIANHARKPIFGYRYMVGSMLAIAGLSFIVWAHHMFTSGMNPLLGTAFMATTLAIAIPSAVKTFNWLATLWRGRIRFTPPMLFALGFVSLFVTGGLTGIILASPPLDVYVHDTYFVVAHFHFVMAAASLFGAFAATYHWFPKMTGRMMDERLGRWHFWLSLVGIYGTFFPMHFLGIAGIPRRYYSYQLFQFLGEVQPLNVAITAFALLLGVGQLVFVYNVVRSLLRGPRADRNPWQATTLEWAAPSPPPHGNWGEQLPTVYRWAYDYSLPGAREDYVPQWVPAVAAAPATEGAKGA